MFDKYYEFRYILYKKSEGEFPYLREHKLTFVCRYNHRYIVNVQEFEYHVYIIKFHLKDHRHSENKYNLQTDYHDATRVITTCIEIMLYFYRKFPLASFGFIGANSVGESKKNTKRYRIYRRLMENFFSPIHFSHHYYEDGSAYLLLNRANTTENLLEKIRSLFIKFYDVPTDKTF